MLVSIGTRSDPKVIAITRAFSRYPELWKKDESVEYVIISEEARGTEVGTNIDKISGVSCIPNGMTETMTGAKNRAKFAYEYAKETERTCTYGVRIRIRNV